MSHFEHKKVLITGGAGFIGSNLASRLVEAGAHVTITDSMIPEYGGNMFNIADFQDLVDFNLTDVRDKESIEKLLSDKDYLFNLAGQTSHLDSMTNPETDLEINCTSQLSILESCKKINRDIKIVFASTRQIYGKPEYLPVDENHPIRPVDVNGINKTAGEWYHILYNNVYDIHASVLRLTNTYGPRMRIKDSRQTFLGIWIREILENKSLNVFGTGNQLRDFNYVDDVVDAMLLVAENDSTNGMIYNLGNSEVISLKTLAEKVIEINGKGNYQLTPFLDELEKIDIGDYYADYSKIKSDLSWEPQINIREGLSRTLSYYQEFMEHYI